MKSIASIHIFRFLVIPLLLICAIFYYRIYEILLVYSLLFLLYLLIYFISLKDNHYEGIKRDQIIKILPMSFEEKMYHISNQEIFLDSNLKLDARKRITTRDCDSIAIG